MSFNIENEPKDKTESSVLEDPVKVEHLKEFKEKLNNNGVVSKHEVLALEEFLADTIITDTLYPNMFSEQASKAGVNDLNKHLDNLLSNIELKTDEVIDMYTIKEDFHKVLNVTNELINSFINIERLMDIEKLKRLEADLKVYSESNDLVTINDINIIDFILNYRDADVLLSPQINEEIRRELTEKEMTYEMVFLKTLDFLNNFDVDDFNPTALIKGEVKYYTVGDVVALVNDISKHRQNMEVFKEMLFSQYRYLDTNEYLSFKNTKRLHKMYTELRSILDCRMSRLVLNTVSLDIK